MIMEWGSIDRKVSKWKLQNIHTGQNSIPFNRKKWHIAIKVTTQHMIIDKQLMISGLSEIKINIKWRRNI